MSYFGKDPGPTSLLGRTHIERIARNAPGSEDHLGPSFSSKASRSESQRSAGKPDPPPLGAWDQPTQRLAADRYSLNDRSLDLSSDLLPGDIKHHGVSAREDQWSSMVGTSGSLEVIWGSDQPVALGADDNDRSSDWGAFLLDVTSRINCLPDSLDMRRESLSP